MARKSEGFGDDIEAAITLLRLKKLANILVGPDCSGCAKRRQRWNDPSLRINQLLHNRKKLE